jgi:hypothetical protein
MTPDEAAAERVRARAKDLWQDSISEDTKRDALVGLVVLVIFCLVAFAIGRWSSKPKGAAPAPAPSGAA